MAAIANREHAATAISIGRRVLDLLLPPICPLCTAPVVSSPGLCARCHAELTLISAPIHPITGQPLPFPVDGDALASFTALVPPVYRRARATCVFDGAGRNLVHALKYRDRHDCAELMARLMERAGRELLDPRAILVPIPLHWRRQWGRRYNQSGLLAAALSRQAGLPCIADALRRDRATAAQVGLTEAQRRANVARAFSANPRRLPEMSNRPVILVDDVMTTGATVEAAARALMEAGAFAVDVLCFAKVVNDADLPL